MFDNQRLAFIGGGNMARSLIGGLVQKGCDPKRIRVADPSAEQLKLISARFPVEALNDNLKAATGADVVVFAVKPQVLKATAEGLADEVRRSRPLVISIAAGVTEPDLRAWLGGEAAIVRVMPNTPALLGAGAAALWANPAVSAAQKAMAQTMLEAVGTALWIEDESLMDAVTALSGSGPAYFFLLMELMEAAALELGLPPAAARQLILQTAFGAARMALESGESPATLRRQVTSPNGTTAAAIGAFEAAGLGDLVTRALTAARDRGRQLSKDSAKGNKP
ncbi:MAG TPA: pyrroline-5-carboxylate reductase [Gammaproteobacteria bacterium]|nr:pyrroline-5-carboxylate reductase [Gammaproteobacteria bacterium]